MNKLTPAQKIAYATIHSSFNSHVNLIPQQYRIDKKNKYVKIRALIL